MNKYIQSIRINWEKLERDSYLNDISSLKNLESMHFNKNITLFAGENGTGKSNLAKQGAQFIIATHSPILLGIPDSEIMIFDNDGISLCKYEDTESYQVTELFINHRHEFLNRLLGE